MNLQTHNIIKSKGWVLKVNGLITCDVDLFHRLSIWECAEADEAGCVDHRVYPLQRRIHIRVPRDVANNALHWNTFTVILKGIRIAHVILILCSG